MNAEQRLHRDSQTTLPETDYFFVGSGKLSACIQWSRDPGATPLGVILQQPEHLTRKWGSYLFHPEYGLERTMISVTIDGVTYRATRRDLCVSRSEHEGVPNILATWKAGEHEVIESFYCPAGASVMVRWICVRGAAGKDVKIETALYANPAIFSRFGSQPNVLFAAGHTVLYLASKQSATINERFMTIEPEPAFDSDVEAHVVYALGNVSAVEIETLWNAEREYWQGTSTVHAVIPERKTIATLFNASAQGLRAVLAESGRFDSSVWQYGMEWGRDASRVAQALVYSGQFERAKTALANILTNLSNDEGQVAEASRFRGGMNSELDSNGFVLEAVATYLDWTNDSAFVADHWPRIKAIADHLLDPEFLDRDTGMLISARDVWERMEAMGIERGYDVAQQSMCIVGLDGIARIVRLLGHGEDAKRCSDAAAKMKQSFLSHPTHSFVAEGRIVKRRSASGSIQHTLNVDRKKVSSDYFAKFVPSGLPLGSEGEHLLEPDVTQLFPILLGIVDASSEVAQNTLKLVGTLWSQAWDGGGIGRYDISGEPDSPGPWSLATILYAQAALRCGDDVSFLKAVSWLEQKAGDGGAWIEFYGVRPTPPLPPVGILPWSWAEWSILVVRDVLGARVVDDELICSPRLSGVSARLRFRDSFVECAA